MDAYEVTRAVYARVKLLDPKNVSKIVGYLLLQDHAEQDMLRLALTSDSLLLSMVAKAKEDLGLLNSSQAPWLPPMEQMSNYHVLQASSDFQAEPQQQQQSEAYYPFMNSFSFPKYHYQEAEHEQAVGYFGNGMLAAPIQQEHHQHQKYTPTPRMFPNDHFYPETLAFLNRNSRMHQDELLVSCGSPSSSVSSSNAWKPCVYFSRGFCKHGAACKFLHTPSWKNAEEGAMVVLPLDKLDMELEEILRSGRKPIVPVSSLPQLYYEKYGKPLQVERYFAADNERFGKVGCTLTRLLAHLKSTVLIDHPNGHQSLALADDALKLSMHWGGENYERNSSSSPSSRQIYLTFPAESTFSEEDVSAHFSAYGPVQDVRIPYQQKRMFGFVTFLHSETVKSILAEGNPHYICGARVLVKPYREKGKHSTKRSLCTVVNGDVLGPKFFDNTTQLESVAQLQNGSSYARKEAVAVFTASPKESTSNSFVNQQSQTDVISDIRTQKNSNPEYLVGDLDEEPEADDSYTESGRSNSPLSSRTEIFPESPAFDMKQQMLLCVSGMEGFGLNDTIGS